ncbi:MAG: methyltransferase domain-containing protein [bacterium]|nr:methyltransferase domain-containing protein [bacterium]
MSDYLNSRFDWDDPGTISVIDELSLWSAPFGLMLLDKVPVKTGLTVLDIGFGTGFPLIELAQRLGNSSTLYGIDPWLTAHERTKLKLKGYGITNVQLVEGDAATMNFENDTFDLIVSNVGVNNFADVEKVFAECFRTSKPGARILLTTNPKGHMKEFYLLMEETIKELNMNHLLQKLETHIAHRLPPDTIGGHLEKAGFKVTATDTLVSYMRFADGSAFLNHALIRYGFLDAWKNIFPAETLETVFNNLETRLNASAAEKGELKISIPISSIEAEKPQKLD